VQKCTLLHPHWFHRNSCNSFGVNGGDDGTRTRGLCRDMRAVIASFDFKHSC